MSSDDQDNQQRMFLDNSANIQKNPEFINFLTQGQENPIKGARLEKMDYLAITIAILETVFVPLIILALVLLVLGLTMSGFLPGLLIDFFNYLDSIVPFLPPWLVNIVVTVVLLTIGYYILKFLFRNKQTTSELPFVD